MVLLYFMLNLVKKNRTVYGLIKITREKVRCELALTIRILFYFFRKRSSSFISELIVSS